jgi:SAM-dependent MidA family methyltransferase
MQLSEIIINKIRNEGPISFHDFMEICLYYPELGYYTSAQDKIGVNGDYFTSPHLTPLFGAMIGKQLEEMWQVLGEDSFTVVEYGAGTGLLSHDILGYLKNNQSLYERLRYCIIEKSPAMREKERSHLQEKVSWYDSVQEIGEVTGCILSNELVDNLPVHVVVMEDELKEVYVDYRDGFVECLQPASAELCDYLQQLQVKLCRGFRTEVNLQAVQWIKEIACALKKGFVITIDYGFPSFELYSDRRRTGTVLCYYNHTVSNNPYCHIGEQDITAHVNFSALTHWGLQNNLSCCGYTDQGHYLRALGVVDYLRKAEQNGSQTLSGNKGAFLAHTLLMDMGSKLKVLIQQKGMREPRLAGLQFSERYI